MGALCLFLAVACGYDYRCNRIPNYLVAVMGIFGVVRMSVLEGSGGAFYYLAVGVIVLSVLYPLFRIGSLGAGDVKLLGVTVGYLPFDKVFRFLFVSLLIAACISLVKVLRENSLLERLVYFCSYISDVIRLGDWRLYFSSWNDAKKAGVCLSGPILVSIFLYMGGFY